MNQKIKAISLCVGIVLFTFHPSAPAFDPRAKFKAPPFTLAQINQRIKMYPNDSDAYCGRGDVYLAAGEVDLAMIDYKRSLSLNPKNVKACLHISQCYSGTGKYDLALKSAENGLKPNTTLQAECINQMIICNNHLHRYDDALRGYAKLLNSTDLGVGPQDRCYLWLDRAEIYIKLRKFDLALKDIEAAERHTISHFRIAQLKATCHLALHQPKLALADYSKGISHVSDETNEHQLAQLYFERAQVYKTLGQTKLADADVAAAGKLDTRMIEMSPFRTKVK